MAAKTTVDAQSSTCKVQGWDAYSKCNDCEQLFDAEGNKISEIPYLSLADHTPTQTATAEYLKSAATCTSPAVYYEHCSVCEVTLSTTFTSGSALGHDYTQKFEDAAHLKTAASKCTEHNIYWYDCSRCDSNAKNDPEAADKYFTSATTGNHSFTEKIEDAAHYVAGTGTDCQSVKKYYYDCAYCDLIGTTTWDSTTYGEHSYAATWSSDESGHWHECSVCHGKKDEATHTPGAAATETTPQKCTECDYIITPALGHTHHMTLVDENPATCTTDGNKAYYVCSGCSKWFEDATGSVEISDHNSVVIGHFGHDFAPATCTAPKTCKRDGCGATEGSALGHGYTKKVETEAYLKTAASKCTEYNVYWYACSCCDANAKDDAEATDKYYTSTTAGAHSFTEQIADEAHQVAGTGTDCQSVKKYYYDCAYCDQVGTTTWDSTAYGPHDYATVWSSDENGHWRECSVCHDEKDGAAHTPNIAAPTETQAKVCTECGYVIAAALGHTHIATGDWQHNTSYHWKVCATCGEKVEKARHDYGTDRTCDICDYVKPKNNNSTTPSQPADTTTKSADTGDMGIALYAGMTILSLTGGAWVVNKKRKGK